MNAVGNINAVSYYCDGCQKGKEAVPMPANMHAVCMNCFKSMVPKAALTTPAVIEATPKDEKKEFLDFLRPFLETDEEFALIKKAYEVHPEKFFIYKDDKGHYGCIYMRIEYEEKVTNRYYIRYIFQDPNLSANDFFKAFLNTTIKCNKFRSSPSPEVFYQDFREANRRALEKFAESLGYWTMNGSDEVWICKGSIP